MHHFGPIQFVPGRKGGRYPYCHSLVLQGRETWVVDPSSDKEFLAHLAQTRAVTAVFLSHFHEDHQKYNYLFPRARFYVPAPEVAAFTSMEGIFRLMGIVTQEFQDYWRQTLLKDFHFRPLTNLSPYEGGHTFQNGDIQLQIIPTPGHTPGHSAFYFPRQELLYLADVDLTPFGPWYGDAASDLGAFEASLDRLQEFQTQTFITAHEQGVFTLPEAREGLAHFRRAMTVREERLLELLRMPRTLPQLVARRPIYRKPKEPAFVYDHMEGQMISKHLDRLISGGMVGLTREGYFEKL
jgi:glyoxylase-like metal-dependent hydrolase (beta-lactamase superfamily II)